MIAVALRGVVNHDPSRRQSSAGRSSDQAGQSQVVKMAGVVGATHSRRNTMAHGYGAAPRQERMVGGCPRGEHGWHLGGSYVGGRSSVPGFARQPLNAVTVF
jgi:hypothetical protein